MFPRIHRHLFGEKQSQTSVSVKSPTARNALEGLDVAQDLAGMPLGLKKPKEPEIQKGNESVQEKTFNLTGTKKSDEVWNLGTKQNWKTSRGVWLGVKMSPSPMHLVRPGTDLFVDEFLRSGWQHQRSAVSSIIASILGISVLLELQEEQYSTAGLLWIRFLTGICAANHPFWSHFQEHLWGDFGGF